MNYPMIHSNRDFLYSISKHIAYLTYADPFKGLEIYEKHASWSLDCDSPMDRMYFHASAAGLFTVLAQEQVDFQIRLPEAYPYPEDRQDVTSLARHLKEMAFDIAGQLDRRNGTAHYMELMTKLAEPQVT